MKKKNRSKVKKHWCWYVTQLTHLNWQFSSSRSLMLIWRLFTRLVSWVSWVSLIRTWLLTSFSSRTASAKENSPARCDWSSPITVDSWNGGMALSSTTFQHYNLLEWLKRLQLMLHFHLYPQWCHALLSLPSGWQPGTSTLLYLCCCPLIPRSHYSLEGMWGSWGTNYGSSCIIPVMVDVCSCVLPTHFPVAHLHHTTKPLPHSCSIHHSANDNILKALSLVSAKWRK